MVKITKTITQPEEVINAFADWRGYQEMVKNPDFVPAQGSPKILDPEHELQDGENPAAFEIDNPDYVPEQGERVIPNPQTRTEFVSELFDEYALNFFAAFVEVQVKRAAEESIKQQMEQKKAEIRQTISTVIE